MFDCGIAGMCGGSLGRGPTEPCASKADNYTLVSSGLYLYGARPASAYYSLAGTLELLDAAAFALCFVRGLAAC